MGKKKMTERQMRFCDEYLISLNATQSYIRAGYNCKIKWARSDSIRLLKKSEVIDYINEKRKKLEELTQITQENVLKELGNIAFTDVTDIVSICENGGVCGKENEKTVHNVVSVKNTKEIPKEKLNAISSIKQGTHGVEIKFNDKLKALELLGRHLGLFHKDKNEFKKVEDNGLISAIKGASGEAWEDEILDV